MEECDNCKCEEAKVLVIDGKTLCNTCVLAHMDYLNAKLDAAEEENKQLREMVQDAYIEGWEDGYARDLSYLKSYELSETRKDLQALQEKGE